MNKTKKVDSNQLLNLPSLSQEQINLIALISALISFVIVLVVYKCIKHLRRSRSNSSSIKSQNSKKYKNVVLVNQNLSKPDLKAINQQFQINTAYSNQANFNRLFPYHNVYSLNDNPTPNLTQQAFYYSDLEIGDQKNPSFNVENNLYLSKKFIQLKNDVNNNSSIPVIGEEKKRPPSINLNNENYTTDRLSVNENTVNNVSTDSSDHRSEESDTDAMSRKGQRLSVARPVSMKFNLLYSNKDKCLYIEVLSVDNLVFNAKQCYFYVKMNLRDNTREQRFKSQKTKITKGTTSVFFNETKQYSINEFNKIEDCTIQLSVYNRIRSLTRKQLIGDLLVDLNRPDLMENVKLMFDEELTPVCLVSGKKLVPTYKTGTLGFLKLELQLTNEKSDQHRIKVTVKNAKNLPLKYNSSLNLNKTNSVFIGHPEFALQLNLFYGQEKLDVKETNSSFSNCPDWDQQIVFNVNEYSAFDEKFILDQNNSANRAELSQRLFKSKLKHLSLQITVVKGNFYSKHAAIGIVKIGDKSSIDGILHWSEMCNSNKSISRWHEIRSIV